MFGSSPNYLFNSVETLQVNHPKLENRLTDALTMGFGTVVSVELKYEWYNIVFMDNQSITRIATLVFEDSFYVKMGFPQIGDLVVLQHSNYENVRIFWRANPKIASDPPFGGKASMMAQSVPSSVTKG